MTSTIDTALECRYGRYTRMHMFIIVLLLHLDSMHTVVQTNVQSIVQSFQLLHHINQLISVEKGILKTPKSR